MTDAALPRHIVRLADAQARRPQPILLEPDAEGRAAVAAALRISGVRKLRLEGWLKPEGRGDWRLEARLGATVVQPCVATLEPVVTRLDEPVERRYVTELPATEADEIEMPDDNVEPLPAALDLGQVMLEALALALPPWPRAAGAPAVDLTVAAPGVAPLTDEEARPFGGLRRALEGGSGGD